MDGSVAQTLAQVITLVAALAALGWSLARGVSGHDRLGLYAFALGNVLVVSGVFLTLGRTPGAVGPALWLHYDLADSLGLLSLGCFQLGVVSLLGLPQGRRPLGAILALAIAALWLLGGPELRARGIVFGSAAALVCGRLAWGIRATLRRRGEQLASGPVILVFGAIALSMGLRAVLLALGFEWALRAEATAVGTSLPTLWAVLVQLMLMNLALVGLMLSRLVQRIQHLARHDPLTGCLNRRALDEYMSATFQARGHAAVLLDLDHFKQVNDEHGHAAGDAALLHVVKLLRAGLREVDRLGRWGGEEFLLLLPETSPAEACKVAERLRAALAHTPLEWQGQTLAITASFSVAAGANPGIDFAALDAGLFRAKAAGRNRVVQVEPPPNEG